MNKNDTDPEKIKAVLWHLVNDSGASANIFTTNRPQNSSLEDFVVVDVNGVIRDGFVDNGSSYKANCICMIQLFAKDINLNGTENMTKLSEMYEALMDILPYDAAPYRFTKKNQVGKRDSSGFHATLVNLDCSIY